MKNKGNLFVIAAPSGTGKTTLVNALLECLDDLTVSISQTTRPMRPGERHGVDYYFISKNEFQHLIDHGDFLEHATIFDNYYGTSKSWVEQTLAQGKDVILEIDWQGQQQIKQLFPESISIFIFPPSLEALEDRLVKRNQDHPEIIKLRLADAQQTMSHAQDFDYMVINDEFTHALNELKTIIEAARISRSQQISEVVKGIGDLS